jgi:hypothetical protein
MSRMPRTVILQSRVDGVTAAQVRVHAERARMSASDWIANVLRRELTQTGDADALALRAYELLTALGYMLRALMIHTLGTEPAETAIEDAAATAAEEALGDLARARELG